MVTILVNMVNVFTLIHILYLKTMYPSLLQTTLYGNNMLLHSI